MNDMKQASDASGTILRARFLQKMLWYLWLDHLNYLTFILWVISKSVPHSTPNHKRYIYTVQRVTLNAVFSAQCLSL